MKFYKTLFSTVFLGGLVFGSNAQNLIYEWGHGLGGTNNDVGICIDNDSNGDIVLVSQYSGTYNADTGPGTTNLISSGGSTDISIVKYDSDGNLIWGKSIGGPLTDEAKAVDIDANGNIYVSGGFQGTAEFDPGAGSQTATSTGGVDIFLLKLDSNGDFQWVYTTGSGGSETGKSVVVGNNNNVYLTGFFRNTVDFDPGLGTQNLTSQGGADVFVLELDDNGNFVSVHQAGGTADEDPSGIALDIYGEIYVTGYFQGTCNFDVNGLAQNLTTAGGNDAFVLKLNSANTFEWVKRIGGTGNDATGSLTTDNKGNILIGGQFSGTVDFDPGAATDNKISNGGLDLMIVKLDNNGDYVFGVSAGGVSDDFIGDISVDMEGNIFTTGVMRNTVDFDPGVGNQNVTVTGGGVFADQFFWKLDENGNYLFAEHSGGTNNDHGFAVHSYEQFIYTTGYFNGTADLDLTAGTETVTTNGGSDISFQKHVNCNPINTTDVIVSCDPITWIDGVNYTTDNNMATMMLTNQYGCDSLVTLDFKIIEVADQSVTPSDNEFCDDGTPTFELGSSETGVFYSLIDQSNGNVLDGPTEGTGAALTLNGGSTTTTTTFEVEAETNKNHKLSFTGNSVTTPTYVGMGNEINTVFAGKDQITVEAWINTDNSNNLQTITSNYNGLGNTMQFVLRIDQNSGSNKAAFWIGTGPNNGEYTPVFGTTTIAPNTWYHVAGTYDGNELSVYVNGVLENTENITATIPYVENEFRIGGGLNNNTEYFYGDITGVRVWNIARTENEINTDKDQCIAGNTPGLVAMYNMIDGEGSITLTDESVNGYNGTLINMDANTSWDYLDLPDVACQLCISTMTQTPTVTINNSNTGTDVQEHCDTYTWIDGVEYTASNNTATFTLTNQEGCDSLVTLDLTINTTPTAGAVDNGDGTISATGTGNYQWIDCSTNTAINGETSDVFTPSQNGDYKVVVFNGSCTDTSDCVTISNVGLYENENTVLSAYPNPTNGSLTLNINSGLISNVAIIDAAGRVILQKQIQASNTVLDLSDMQNGVYFVEVENENKMKTMVRVVKK